MVTGAAKGLVKTADLATLGTFSSAGTRLGTFFGTDGTLEERAEAANEEGNRAQLNTVTLGFSEAEDKGEHARQLLRQTFAVDQFKQGSEQLAEGIVNDNLDQTLRGGAQILGASSQVTLVVAGTAQAAESVVGGVAETGAGAEATATRSALTTESTEGIGLEVTGSTANETVTVFRVEGAGNQRLSIGTNGSVEIPQVLTKRGTERNLYLNFGDEARAQEFLQQRLEKFPDNTIKSFEVPKSFVDKLKANAISETERSLYPNRPVIADPTKASSQFGLSKEQIEQLRREVIRGSGKNP